MFIPFASIRNIDVRQIEEDGAACLVIEPQQSGVVALETGEALARALRKEMRSRMASPPTEPTPQETSSYRDGSLPVPELVRILRDPAQPRAERIRIADVLADQAAEEVRLVAEETADEELAQELAARTSPRGSS